MQRRPTAALERKRPALLFMGGIAALSFTLMAFEWRHYVPKDECSLPALPVELPPEYEPIPIAPRSKPDRPAPPKPKTKSEKVKIVQAMIDVVDDTVPIDSMVVIDPNPDPIVEPIALDPEPDPIEPMVDPYELDEMPEFPGGEKAMFEFLGSETQYPERAKRREVQGTVYVSFVIEKDGSVTNVEAIRGIGDGCDIEAERVVTLMPKWTPGKQRGHPVRVSYKLPLKFVLRK